MVGPCGQNVPRDRDAVDRRRQEVLQSFMNLSVHRRAKYLEWLHLFFVGEEEFGKLLEAARVLLFDVIVEICCQSLPCHRHVGVDLLGYVDVCGLPSCMELCSDIVYHVLDNGVVGSALLLFG